MIKVKLLKLLDLFDLQMQEVLKNSAIAFILKIMGTALNFGYNAILARMLGADGVGIYFLSLTVVTIASVIARLGLDHALLRFIAASKAAENWDEVNGVYRVGIKTSLVVSCIITTIVYFSSESIAHVVFGKEELIVPLKYMSISIVPFSLLTLYSEILKGVKRIGNAMLVQSLAIPLFSIPIYLLITKKFNVIGATIAFTVSTILVLIMAHILWLRAIPRDKRLKSSFDYKKLFNTSLPLFGIAILNLLIGWTDTIVLGIWLDSTSVGIYGIAFRIATITSFVLVSVNSIVAPKFAALYANGEMEALAKLARQSARLMITFAAPLLFIFIIFPKWLLAFFGAEFKEGALALTILSIGQFINVATGSVGYLLIMSGNQRIVQNVTFISATINVLLVTTLVPVLGITGAAIGTAISIAFINIILSCIVYLKLSILIVPFLKAIFQFGDKLLGKDMAN